MVDENLQLIRASVPKECLWVVADEAVLRAIRRQTYVRRGPRGDALRRIIRSVRWQRLQLLIVLVVGVISTLRILLQQRASPENGPRSSSPETNGELTIFVGFGARAEARLFDEYRKCVTGETIRVNQVDIATMASVQHVGVITLYREVFAAFRNLRDVISRLPKVFDAYRVDWIVFAAMRLATYAHAKTWFTAIGNSTSVREACFLSPDTTAFAAIDAGIACHYYQHGLLGKNVMLPPFDRVSAITQYEAEYIRQMIGNVEVTTTLIPKDAVKIDERNALVIASAKRVVDEMKLATPLVIEANSLGLSVHVRPFIGEELTAFWDSPDVAPNAPFVIESSDGSFNNLVDELKAMFIVSWGSTVLVDALYMGIIPICVADHDDHYVKDTVYPLLQCCLHWPRDRQVIHQATRSQMQYANALRGLRDKELLIEKDCTRAGCQLTK